ncbi:hypothetical protein LTR10_021925 [Elasticomyces elasticus]|uniref:Transcription factor domain-containing protein n=1 Tax=Exophiala sideris TaxID=1016849 RepID=A0ABR0IWL5_9EURO|nr:hypothetical protein LTR10_021925 [Elasticomyces elasticus]KAK5021843.1 hypothetical protein LTS07_010584 [Exophiala sideris]KAK5025908.1 hypothetical protein LTR13_010221 [Exophiala sideris]KAK5050273.1 hypothetical protein LTR69_010608 [Exophiala sideris]KAK5177122.1 hypothetical protein LTR44_010406 [Eurotiomycetes sp. CCFEE 6388]
MPDPTFVNYSHPQDQNNRRNRQLVASYIGTHFRNRSRPSSRRVLSIEEASEPLGQAGDEPGIQAADFELPSEGPSNISARLPATTVPHDRHGLRSDPFYSYPIEFRQCIPAAVDYFLTFYGPAHVIRPEILSAEAGADILHQYFQYALQNALMFEALIALSQANLTVHQWTNGPDQDALYHYNQALRRLRDLLDREQDYSQDSILFAIIALMGVDVGGPQQFDYNWTLTLFQYLNNDLTAFEMHLGGLRKIVDLRGGLDNLGWPLILRPYLLGLERFWAYMSKHSQTLQASIAQGHNVSLLELSHHTPIANFADMISVLPPGFRTMALNNRLSQPVLTLLHRITTEAEHIIQINPSYGSSTVNATNMQEAEHCAQLLTSSDLTFIDRASCIGLLVVIMDSSRTERFSGYYDQQLQMHAEEIRLSNEVFQDADLSDFYLWVALDIVGTMVPPRRPALPENYQADTRFTLLLAVLQNYGDLSWEEVLTVLKRFFFTARCVESWHNSWELGFRHLNEDSS